MTEERGSTTSTTMYVEESRELGRGRNGLYYRARLEGDSSAGSKRSVLDPGGEI